MIKMGEFVKKHGLAAGMERELTKIVQKFAIISKQFDELSEELKEEKRAEYYEAQNIFFKVGATIAERFAKKDEMQTDDQQSVSGGTGAVENIGAVQVRQNDNTLSWVPYVQFRKVLQPVLELESGNLTSRTMGDIYHALEVFKQKVNAIELELLLNKQ